MVSGELENSLRAEVETYINSRLSGLQEEVARLQSQVNEAFTRLQERAQDAAQPDTEVASSISEVIRAAHERGMMDAAAESVQTKASSEMALLKAAIEDLSEQRTQSEILSTLVNRAASFAPRIAFFVIKNELAVGWRARGLEGTVGDEAVREIQLPLSADTPLSDVVRSRTTWSGQPGGNAEDYLLLNKLGTEPPQRMVAVPLVARGRAAAVLYADSAGLDAEAINLEAIETLVRVAGMAVELTAAAPRTGSAPQPAQAQPARQPAAEARMPVAAEAAAPREDEPSEVTAEAPAIAEERQETAPAFERQPERVEEIGEETVVMEAPAQIEASAQPAPATPQAEVSASEPFNAPLGGARRYGRAADAAELPVEVSSDDERRLHNDARRFARLLISEIKLYNKEKVEEGRQVGDLYERLREDIDRSRQMYDKRVAPPVAARYDYFHQELINTLAEGDPSKLGSAYPGAAV